MPIDHGACRTHARQRRHAEAAGIAEAVEHMLEAQALGVVGKTLAAVALVQVEAGLVALGDVERQAPLVFVDGEFKRWPFAIARHARGPASQPARGGLQTFQRTHAGV